MANLSFAPKAAAAKAEIDDALAFLKPAVNAVAQHTQVTPQGLSMAGALPVGPGQLNVSAGMQLPGAEQGGPAQLQNLAARYQMPMAGGQLGLGAQGAPSQLQNLGVDFSKGNTQLGVNYSPQQQGVNLSVRRQFAKGGAVKTLSVKRKALTVKRKTASAASKKGK